MKAMETGQNLNGIGLTIGSILGYIAILAGIIMTILLLETVFWRNNLDYHPCETRNDGIPVYQGTKNRR